MKQAQYSSKSPETSFQKYRPDTSNPPKNSHISTFEQHSSSASHTLFFTPPFLSNFFLTLKLFFLSHYLRPQFGKHILKLRDSYSVYD